MSGQADDFSIFPGQVGGTARRLELHRWCRIVPGLSGRVVGIGVSDGEPYAWIETRPEQEGGKKPARMRAEGMRAGP